MPEFVEDKQADLVDLLMMIGRVLSTTRDLDESQIEAAEHLALTIKGLLDDLLEDLGSHSKYVAHCEKSKITLHKKAPQN